MFEEIVEQYVSQACVLTKDKSKHELSLDGHKTTDSWVTRLSFAKKNKTESKIGEELQKAQSSQEKQLWSFVKLYWKN